MLLLVQHRDHVNMQNIFCITCFAFALINIIVHMQLLVCMMCSIM
jgi:hypothetical protein